VGLPRELFIFMKAHKIAGFYDLKKHLAYCNYESIFNKKMFGNYLNPAISD
jgi:hypothetical protein